VAHPTKSIVSLFADDPSFDERIDAFVIALGEKIDELQDAELAADPEPLRTLAASLAGTSETLGYPALVAAARRVSLACDDGPESIHKAVVDLTELGQRVRRGHRSSAG
jgi:HPt (histidine-containing phosphotransfer) domain-containing protein